MQCFSVAFSVPHAQTRTKRNRLSNRLRRDFSSLSFRVLASRHFSTSTAKEKTTVVNTEPNVKPFRDLERLVQQGKKSLRKKQRERKEEAHQRV